MTEKRDLPSPTFTHKALSLLVLTGVSTAIGIVVKLSQTKGVYGYSPASALAMAELYKLIATLIAVWHLAWAQREVSPSSVTRQMFHILTDKVSLDLVQSQFLLGFMYAFVNFITFPILMYMSASCFYLLKTASPVVTAVVLRVMSRREITPTSWFSISMQCLGLFITQVNLCNGVASTSILGYLMVLANIVSSCVAGVYNERIIKTQTSSLNTQNFIMYSFGFVICMLLHFLLPPVFQGVEERQGFFEGYGAGAILFIILNGSFGLLISTVYKYGDDLVKTFGVSLSTLLLFLFESLGILPEGRRISSLGLNLCGTVTVFYAAYVYVSQEQTVSETYNKLGLEEMEEGENAKKSHGAAAAVTRASESAAGNSLRHRICDHSIGLLLVGFASVSMAFSEYNECSV